MSQQITPGHLDIVIFDVEHGNCAFVQTPSGETLMLDCGHTADFSPAEFIYINDWTNEDKLEKLVISHPDEDHISDIERTISLLKPRRYQHPSLTSEEVTKHLQPKPKTPLAHYHKITGYPRVSAYEFPNIETAHFKTREIKFDANGRVDTNYLSVVTFISYNGVSVCFPGDITDEGLSSLLLSKKMVNGKSFVDYIKETDIFVAPHHGRVCEEDRHEKTVLSLILNLMEPDTVIISDKTIEGQNENTAATGYYESYVPTGLVFGQGTPFEKTRRTLTTRNDGTIHIVVSHPAIEQRAYSIYRNAFASEIENFKKIRNKVYA